MSYTRWKIPYGDAAAPRDLLDEGYSPLLAAVLCRRGMADPDSARRFIDCGEEVLGDAMAMKGMPQAVKRLRAAVDAREKIAVYGDYDVDGITSTCLLTDYLRSVGADCVSYIPDRLEEGYGVNTAAIERLHREGVSLIVTVDCGVTAVKETRYAASLGVDMIITDHHECPEELPDAVAVVDPKRADCAYPGRDLAGVGVAFKLLCAMEGDAGAVLSRCADLVAVGTIADVMPITGENRYIIKSGLEKLSRSPRVGLRALIAESGLNERRISATNVGFTLAPRLNVSGRLGRAELAQELLLTRSRSEAETLAAELCQLNRDRQALETQIWDQAQAMLGKTAPSGPIVLCHEGWHQGVIGIVASRLAETYNVPAVMICLDGENGKGSCRSFGGFNLFDALGACSDCLCSFGGHALAAGLTIKRGSVDAFRRALGEYYRANPASGESVLDIDIRVDRPELLEMRCVEDLERLEPCGSGNPGARLCLCRAVLESVTPIGGGRHLRLRLGRFGRSYDAVYFSKTESELGVRAGDCVDAAFQAQINEFRLRRSVQLLITDLRAHDFLPALAVLAGTLPEPEPELAPSRSDLARVWRALCARGGEVTGVPQRLFDSLAPGMWDVKLCLCLKVFEELGLLAIEQSGARWTVRRSGFDGKADLAASEILRRFNSPVKEADRA